MRQQVKNLHYIFNPSSIAIVGASKTPSKIGHAILQNLVQGGFSKKIFPINPNEEEILSIKCYKCLSDVPQKIDCAVIATPASTVYSILEEAAKLKIPSAVVISGGFSEIGNSDGEQKIKQLADKHEIALIGPNCMGVLNPSQKVDSVFLPMHKLTRPRAGEVALISQSGAVGGCIVDLAAEEGIGVSKFVSYGNAACIDETDLLDYLYHDDTTKSIISYMEGVHDGRKFMRSACALTSKKPLIVLKAGKSKSGSAAALSHTASMAGSYKVFSAALQQCGAIEAQNLGELFELSKIFSLPNFYGSRIAVLTNGGGNGVLAADAIEKNGLELAEFSPATMRALKTILPPTANAKNPLDIIGDATSIRYQDCFDLLIDDDGVDAIICIVLMQTAALDSSIINTITNASFKSKKPIVVVSTGGEYTRIHCKMLEDYKIPTYSSPTSAVGALAKAQKYNIYKLNLER